MFECKHFNDVKTMYMYIVGSNQDIEPLSWNSECWDGRRENNCQQKQVCGNQSNLDYHSLTTGYLNISELLIGGLFWFRYAKIHFAA